MDRKCVLRKSICIGFLAAVMLSAFGEKDLAAANQVFLFPQFSSAAASDRGVSKDNDCKITYSFKLAEILERLFS